MKFWLKYNVVFLFFLIVTVPSYILLFIGNFLKRFVCSCKKKGKVTAKGAVQPGLTLFTRLKMRSAKLQHKLNLVFFESSPILTSSFKETIKQTFLIFKRAFGKKDALSVPELLKLEINETTTIE